MPGFRITLSLEGLSGSASGKRKCLVFIDDQWTKVADLEAHMAKIFGVKHLEIFIDDCWVSSEEPICIIKPSDNITVKKVKSKNEAVETSFRNASEEDSQEKKEKRHKKKKMDPTVIEPEINDDALLAAKKEELLSKVDASLREEEMDVTDNPAGSSKKRRHRKRPNQKRRERLERHSMTAALQSCFLQPTEATTLPAAPVEEISTETSHSHHIRFDEEPVQDNNDACTVTTVAPKEDWQERLLALAQERNKPVFVRREVFVENGHSEPSTLQNGFQLANGLNGTTNGDGGESLKNDKSDYPDVCQSSILHNSVPTDVAKTSDVLCFKKLTVLDGQPGVSDYLLALVEEVDEDGSLILKILEGEPEQAFSPHEIQDSEGGCFIVRVAWKHIIEPRLVVETSLLSKYL